MLILIQFFKKITNLSQQNHENVNFELIFIKNHRFESTNHENVNFESIFIKNHKFESKIMKILILSQFLSKIINFYENHAATQRDAARRSATQRDAARRSATPTGNFATQRDAD